MTTDADAEQLRTRARSIRALAALVDDCGADRLATRAGLDTWIGPTAEQCRHDLERMRHTVRVAHEQLLVTARRLEAQADLES